MLYLIKKKKKKNTCTYHYWNLHDMIYSSWDTAKQMEIGNFSSFFPLHPPKNPKTQHFEKWKNLLELSFYTCAPKITMIWFTVPEICSETDKNFVILDHFLPFNHSPQWSQISKYWKKWKRCLEILSFYTHMCTINEDHMIYGSWNITCDRQKFSTFWAISCPLSPLTTWKIKILTLKNTTGDITLHRCTINDNHMI